MLVPNLFFNRTKIQTGFVFRCMCLKVIPNSTTTTRLQQLSSTLINVQPTHCVCLGYKTVTAPGVTAPSDPMTCVYRDFDPFQSACRRTYVLLLCTVHRREKIKIHHPAATREDKLFFVNTGRIYPSPGTLSFFFFLKKKGNSPFEHNCYFSSLVFYLVRSELAYQMGGAMLCTKSSPCLT